MNQFEHIASLLKLTDEFKVEKGKVFVKDMFGDFIERAVNSVGKIDLKYGLFDWSDVKAVIEGKIPKEEPPEFTAQQLSEITEKFLKRDVSKDEVVQMHSGEMILEVKKTKKGTKMKLRAALREDQIKIIRQRLSEEVSINKIAEELGVERFPVMYVVKQIKAGKKLRYE